LKRWVNKGMGLTMTNERDSRGKMILIYPEIVLN
jgi:hypothetical protein